MSKPKARMVRPQDMDAECQAIMKAAFVAGEAPATINFGCHLVATDEAWAGLAADVAKELNAKPAPGGDGKHRAILPCCDNENRSWNGGCLSCGDPSF